MPPGEPWVTEYLSPPLLRSHEKHQPLFGRPIRFYGTDWNEFIKERGWRVAQIRYLGEESERLRRPVPLSFPDRVFCSFPCRSFRDMGCEILERLSSTGPPCDEPRGGSCSRQEDTRGHRTTRNDTGRHVEPGSVRGASNLRIRWPKGRGSSSLPSRTVPTSA